MGRSASLVRLLSAKPHALLISFMTARRLRAYPLPAKRSAAPSASDSKTRMHAACMVLANLLIILASIRDVNVALIYARRSIVHRQLRLPQVSHDLYIFPTVSATPTWRPHTSWVAAAEGNSAGRGFDQPA